VAWSRVLGQGKHKLELQGLTGQTALDAILILR
jgi:hypothetical protein